MRILIIINEPFTQAVLGKSTTLSYILSCFELGHEVYVFDLAKTNKNFPNQISDPIEVIDLNSAKVLYQNLSEEYKNKNIEILEALKADDLMQLVTLKEVRAEDIINETQKEVLLLQDVDFIVQRLEPMSPPFPPKGNEDINEFLTKLKNLFPSKIFNCPINLEDKESAIEISNISVQKNNLEIAIPTTHLKIKEHNHQEHFLEIIEKYKKFYGETSSTKIVLKPKSSAQSFGVFAIEFTNKGYDLETIERTIVEDLTKLQIYQIRPNLSSQELENITQILCYIQVLKTDKTRDKNKTSCLLKEISKTEINQKAQSLYHEEILIQPFLEGIRSGDIRTNFLKNDRGDFYIVGHTFRKSLRKEIENFTTCYTVGKAAPQSINHLFREEKEDLLKKSEILTKILNTDLREKYHDVVEIGSDFILVGDGKTVLLGEINHHCQALIPAAEAINKALDQNANYDGGLFFTKKLIEDLIKLQGKN